MAVGAFPPWIAMAAAAFRHWMLAWIVTWLRSRILPFRHFAEDPWAGSSPLLLPLLECHLLPLPLCHQLELEQVALVEQQRRAPPQALEARIRNVHNTSHLGLAGCGCSSRSETAPSMLRRMQRDLMSTVTFSCMLLVIAPSRRESHDLLIQSHSICRLGALELL